MDGFTFAQKKFHDAKMTLGSGSHQRSASGAVRLLDGSSAFQQRLGHFPVAFLHGANQRWHILKLKKNYFNSIKVDEMSNKRLP